MSADRGTAEQHGSPSPGIAAEVALAGIPRGSAEAETKRAVRACAETATDFSWLGQGDSVFIKLVHNSDEPYPATTSPPAVAAMIELLRERGAGRIVVGDMGGILFLKLTPHGVSGSTRTLMERTGMAATVAAARAELHAFEEAGWEGFYPDEPVGASHWNAPIMMPNILREVDHLVLMPRCARHALAGNTLGLKAAVGYWRTDTRLQYHKNARSFHEKTADANTVPTLLDKQRLVVSAADKILTTYGPDQGYVVEPETGLVIGSESVTGHDMISLAWLLIGRAETPPQELGTFKDPYTSSLIVNMANRWIVARLGGIGNALAADRLSRHDLLSIWDDRTLNRAYQVLGGRPGITLKRADDQAPERIAELLDGMTTPRT